MTLKTMSNTPLDQAKIQKKGYGVSDSSASSADEDEKFR